MGGVLPTKVLRVEVKFTTSRSVLLPLRELEALRPNSIDESGALVCLFWNGDTFLDGRWWFVNQASPTLAAGTAIRAESIRALALNSILFTSLSDEVSMYWWAFLERYHEVAMGGQEALLERLREDFSLNALRPKDLEEVLESERRGMMNALIDKHGEQGLGRLLQHLVVYLIASFGYRKVTVNSVGVPDATLDSGEASGVSNQVHVIFTPSELFRLIELCSRAGECELMKRLASHMESREEGTTP